MRAQKHISPYLRRCVDRRSASAAWVVAHGISVHHRQRTSVPDAAVRTCCDKEVRCRGYKARELNSTDTSRSLELQRAIAAKLQEMLSSLPKPSARRDDRPCACSNKQHVTTTTTSAHASACTTGRIARTGVR
jgi:hypothetical protein